MLNVAIAVDPGAHYGPEAVHVIVAACEEVLGEGRCPAASELGPGMVTAWYALVHPDDPGLGSARIEFRDRAADGILIEERSLTFPRGASQQSHLASIGSVIAALAAAREGAPIPYRPRPKPPKPSVQPVRTAPPLPSPPPDWSVGLAAFATPSFGAGPYRWGALGSAQLGFESRLFARVSGSYAVHPGNPRLSWLGMSAGLGTRVAERAAPFNVELGAEFVFQHTSATAQRGIDQETAAQNGWGGRIGGGAVWAGWQHASLVSGVDATLILPRVHVTIGGQNVTQVPLVTVAFFLGVRFLP
jgi:hypothetical protein